MCITIHKHSTVPPYYPVHLSSGSLHVSPNPSKTLLSASCHVFALVLSLLHLSKSTHRPVPRSLTPLLSNFHPFTFFAYRLRSLSNVVPDVHPCTAQPTVRHGLMIISTLRCGFGFLAFGSAARSAARVGHSCDCHTTSALSRVSKPWPPPPTGARASGCWSRFELVRFSDRVCVMWPLFSRDLTTRLTRL